MITDPPYGIDYGKAGGHLGNGWKARKDKCEWDHARPPKESIDLCMKAGKIVVIWGGNYFIDWLPPSMCWLIWDKVQRGFSLADCEMAWTNQRKASRVISYARGKESGCIAKGDGYQNAHPTQKPIGVMKWCIDKSGNPESIADPFMGSGSTGVAAMQMGRKFIGVEIDEDYFKIACERIRKAQQQIFFPYSEQN